MSITSQLDAIAIRPARDTDATRLRWLAQRDSAALPAGGLLVAEVGGAITAAVAIDTGETIADPFRRTSELVALLRMRAEQARGRRAPLQIVARSHPRLARPRRRHAAA
jgi:hypothetical protein